MFITRVISELTFFVCNRTVEERRQRTLYDKHDKISFGNIFHETSPSINRYFCTRSEHIMLSEVHDEQARHLFFQTAILLYELTFNDLWLPT